MENDADAHGAIAIDASEGGFLIYSTEDIPIGTKLKITVLFPAEYELAKFEVFAEIIWKTFFMEKGDVEKGEEGVSIRIKNYPNFRGRLLEIKKTSQRWI